MRIANASRGLVLAVALTCAGCASGVYKDEADKVGDSAKALAGALTSRPARADLDITTDMLLLGGPIRYDTSCARSAFTAYEGVIQASNEDQSARDRAYAALLATPGCGLATTPAAPAPREATAEPGGAPDDGFAARQLERDQVRQEAQQERRRPPGPTPVPSGCNGSCTLEDYTRQIAAYGEAIEEGGRAEDVGHAQGAVDKAGAAAKGLLAAAHAPPLAGPVVQLLAGLGKMAIQQARYAAMKRAVILFDAAWSRAAPAVEQAARLRQAERISVAADAAASASLASQQYVNDDRYFRTPAERLRLFESLNAKAEAADAALAAAKTDPARLIAAFTRANRSLALAMENPRRQAATLEADVKGLKDEISAVRDAAAKS